MRAWHLLRDVEGFDWDEGNLHKNLTKHEVEFWEAEEVFLNRPLVVKVDSSGSANEQRFLALGHSDTGRRLFVAFTVRERRIRVISARDMTRREKAAYQHHA